MKNLLIQLNQGKVIIYPTESMFGLGCDPDNKQAISTLLKIKNRSWRKGLILIAANYTQLLKYIDDSFLNENQQSQVFSTWPGPVTWVFPAKSNTPYWLTGQFSSLAVRVIHFELIQHLCLAFGKPLVSTSANLSGQPPARTIKEIHEQLGHNMPIMYEDILGRSNPSEIRDVMTGKLIRGG
ncbi:Sua5/YciO/YrdC/YwlC family protein [Blochmannia endosymbiont of Camponotus sp. C-003]|uniref:Sua5/YciO/YrdC/YwlC family protein n=1 Tax=unclassified Candidatus Blochmanniella TaxID=711328 RepID=UPI0020242965|nr:MULTISPECIES: Sua5/YciO/YrdC/YwlC family protein [unclassified Candidatus Blochmannia]URJ23584.1 Sua5/YciO/YrdC/YwlC family protein [Blochmannia endosymbiont of Camponotus sp. C-003]URJ28500.1 Sua5/YciO/YrdC/YwlC family protein [Blochmannia endosymbiont of Camponotus sp. C-046]